jgi:hypothetical protein
MIRFLSFSALIICTLSSPLFAQNEVARERSSLNGISELGVVINIEKPASVSSAELNPARIKTSIERSFTDLPLALLTDDQLRESDAYPILYIHVNVMKAGSNLYPFSIEQSLYQPVKLMLQNDLRTTAATWNKGQVGVVSTGNLSLIAEEAIAISRLFYDEFKQVNQ